MKEVSIGGKKYTLEYTVGASLYDDCVVSVMNLIASAAYSETETDDPRKQLSDQLSLLGGIPKVALTIFYAGLLEHHGTGEFAGNDSDESVTDIRAARSLIAEYVKDNKESGNGTFMDILNMCIECMGDDGFLTLIGIDKMMEIPETTPKAKRGRPKKTDEKIVSITER